MKFVHEHEVHPSYNDFEDEAKEITLRTLIDFEVISADGKTVSVEALGAGDAKDDFKRPLSIHGTLIQPIDPKWRSAISTLASTAPHVEPKSHDDVRSSVAPPVKRAGSSKADTSSIVSGDDNVSLSESMVSESMASENPYTASILPFDRASLTVGDAVDGYCNKTFKWYGAKVVKVDGDQLKVHFLGWKDRHDEWLHRDSERLAAKGSSLSIMFEEAKKLSNLVPWYDSDRLYKKASQSLGVMPSRERIKVYIEDVEDWCIDYTYANPTLWVISAAGIWYRIAGALVPGGASGSPKPHYAAVFHDTVIKFNCASHVVMCLLDFLPGRPKLDVDFIVEEVSARTKGKINGDTILRNYNFLIDQIQALAQPPEWHTSINLAKCFFVQNLAKRGAALENGGKRKGSGNEEFGDNNGPSSKKAKPAAALPPVYREDFDEVPRRVEPMRLKGPINDEELSLMEAQRGVAAAPFPAPSGDKGKPLRCPPALQKMFLHAWATLMNFKTPLSVPYMSPEFLEECLYAGSSASSSCNFIVKELHLALLAALLADRLRSGKAPAVRVTPDADLSDDELSAVSSLLLSHSWTAQETGEGVFERKIKGFLAGGGTWVELARVLVAEQHEYALPEYRDPVGECAAILEAIIKDCPNDVVYFLSLDNFPTPDHESAARDLSMVQARLKDGFYDEPRLFDLHLRAPVEGAYVGRLVDAYSEKRGVWYPARVVAHSARAASVTVHFLEFGNGSTYDEVVPLSGGGLTDYCTISTEGARRRMPPKEAGVEPLSFGETEGVRVRGSSRPTARGHAGFAADVRAVLQEAPLRYRDKDLDIVSEAARNVCEVFERLYEKNVLVHELKAEQLLAARRAGKVAATSSNGYWASIVSFDELLAGLGRLTYHELAFETKLQLLNWLCDAYVNTSACKSYIEELVELKYVQNRESKMKSKKGDEATGAGGKLRLSMSSRLGEEEEEEDDEQDFDFEGGMASSQQYDVARFPDLFELTARLLPAGSDRDGRNYWIFAQDRSPRIFCEEPSSSGRGSWFAFYGQEEVGALYLWLRDKGLRESKLRKVLAAWLAARGWEVPRKPTKASRRGEEDTDPFQAEDEEAQLTPYKRNTRRCTETAQRKSRAAEEAERSESVEEKLPEASKELLQLFVRPDKGVQVCARLASFTVSVDVGYYGQLGVGVKEVFDTVIVNSFKYTDGSPSAAESAGVRIGDRVAACNGKIVSRISDLQAHLKDINASDVKLAHLFILRRTPDQIVDTAMEHDSEMRQGIVQQSKKDVASAAAFAKICSGDKGEVNGNWVTRNPYFEQGLIPGHLVAGVMELLCFAISVCVAPNAVLNKCSGLEKKATDLLDTLLLASFSKSVVAPDERLIHMRPEQVQRNFVKRADLVKPDEWLLALQSILPQVLLETEEVLDLFRDVLHPSWYEGRRRFKWRKQCLAASSFAQLSLCTSVLREVVQMENVGRRRAAMPRSKAIAQYTNAINHYGTKNKQKLPRPIREIPSEWMDVLYYGDGHAAFCATAPQGRSDVAVGDVLSAPMPGAIIPCQVAVTKVYITGDADSPQTWTAYCQLDLCVLPRINMVKYGMHDKAAAPIDVEPAETAKRKRLNRIVLRAIAIITQSRDSKPFEYPVDKQLYPDYYSTIEKPIAFADINERAFVDGYSTVEEALQDISLLRNNCRTFCAVDFPELVVAAEAIYAEALHLLTVTFAEEISSGVSTVFDAEEPKGASGKSKGAAAATPVYPDQLKAGTRFSVVISLDSSAPLFVVPLKTYVPSLAGLSLERRFVVTSGEGEDEYESSGAVVGSKPIVATEDSGTTFVPWNWLAVEWSDLDDLEGEAHGRFINPWAIDRKKFDSNDRADDDGNAKNSTNSSRGSENNSGRGKYKHSEAFLKKREQNLKNNSSRYYRNQSDSDK